MLEISSVIEDVSNDGGDIASVRQVGYETIVVIVAESSVEVIEFAHELYR